MVLSTGLMIYTGHRKEFSINDVLNVSPTSEQIIHTEVSNLNPVAKKTDFFERKYISVDKRMFNRFSCNLEPLSIVESSCQSINSFYNVL